MENRNELSDIVLEKGDTKTLKMKRILILVAFLILVFLVALASMKVANKDEGKDTSKLILPPEPTQETQIPKDDQLFKQVPIIEENPKKESFEDMIKTLKEKEAQKQEEAKGTEAKPKESATTSATPPVKETLPKVKEETKKEATKTQPLLRSTEISDTPSGSANAGIYVQVGAVATTPDAKQLSDIKSKGFEYKLYPTVVNGNKVTKILIGPYAKSSDAESALVLIRSSVNKNAFIYRVK
ncbi:SPOR domain-containing protein [Sulfurospirillum multivorans]|uniref:Membrane protein n=2 Tax=Sulfurospirillum multivorans TaxID=66821 RepID=A0AA86AJT2_SULMK|nr:SPOR domain-containing protein [Sulfurospirillum multivorans]AHJ12020.1 membrane protein [Sulfurospirillum multivorans DSM 12446]QEH05523.1 membrane protein [Sulfurospirillum multivorans]